MPSIPFEIRDHVRQLARKNGQLESELGASERTVRNQQLEIDRLKLRLRDTIDREILLVVLRRDRQNAADGEDRNPDDSEWTTIRETYDGVIATVEAQPHD